MRRFAATLTALLAFCPALLLSAPFLTDNFTGTDGTALTAHTSDSGHTWASHPSWGTGGPELRGGFLSPAGGTQGCYASVVPPSAEQKAVVAVRRVTETGVLSVFLRMSTTQLTYVQLLRTDGGWYLYETVGGVGALLDDYAVALPTDSDQTVTFIATETTAKVYIDGVLRMTGTLSTVTGNGRVGIFTLGGSSSTGYRVNALTAEEFIAGPLAAETPSLSSRTTTTATLALSASGGVSPYSTQVQRAPDVAGEPGTWANVGSPVTGGELGSYTDTGLTANTTYHYRTVVTDADLSTDTSDAVEITTLKAIPVTSSALFFSPYNWESDGTGAPAANGAKADATYVRTSNPGAYFKAKVTTPASGSVLLILDTTFLQGLSAGDCAVLSIVRDGLAATTVQLAYSATPYPVTLASGLSAGSHEFRVSFKSVSLESSYDTGDRWNGSATGANVVKITGLGVDPSATAGTVVPRPNRLLCYGDSITEGANAVGTGSTTSDQDATKSYATLLGDALDAEVGVIGWGATGWTVGGWSNVPDFEDSWDNYRSGVPRLFGDLLSPAPDYVTINHGFNDGYVAAPDVSVQAAMVAVLPELRTAAPDAVIAEVVPFAGSKRSAITAAVEAADAGVYLVDLEQDSAYSGVGSAYTTEGTHLNVSGHTNAALRIAQQLLDPSTPGSLGTPHASRTWRAVPEFRPVAGNILEASPLDDELYGLNLDPILPAGVTVDSVVVTADADDDDEALEVSGEPEPNGATFDDDTDEECPAGRGVVFALAGGSLALTHLPNYRVTVDCELSNGRSVAIVCRLRVTDEL